MKEPNAFHLGFEMKDEQGKTLYQCNDINGLANERLIRVNYINPNPLFLHSSTLKEVRYHEDRKLSGTEDWLYHLQIAARYDIIAFDKIITSCMIQHNDRSMNTFSGDNLLQRAVLLIKYLKEDAVFMNKYGHHINKIYGETISLAALHFILEKKKIKGMRHALRSFKNSPPLFFKRRTFAFLKYIIKP